MSGSRGEANFVWKCKSCKVCNLNSDLSQLPNLMLQQRESSATIKEPPISYKQGDPPTRQKVIEFDCRGLEFTEFKPEVWECPLPKQEYILTQTQGDWLATGTDSGSKFTAIDLTDGEWYDYDEKAGEEVSIKSLKWEIRRN